MSEKFMNYCQ